MNDHMNDHFHARARSAWTRPRLFTAETSAIEPAIERNKE